MALSIRSNLTSLRSLNHLARTDRALSTVLERLSTGSRINRSADGPTDLAIGTRLETETIAVRQAIRNANDGITIVQTADAASSEVTDLLQRMRELAVTGSGETLSASERTALNDEYVELREEISRIAVSTEFNDISLSSGDVSSLNIQVGINSGASNRIEIDLGDLQTDTLGINLTGTTSQTSILDSADAITAIDILDTALDTVSGYRTQFGASEIRLDTAVNFATALDENLVIAESNVMDANTAFLTSELTRLTLLGSGAVAALAQASSINELVVSQLLLN
jgi:flagellin